MTGEADDVWVRLRELDDPVNVERPAEFDASALLDRFTKLAERLDRDFSCRCKVDAWPNVQDASFYGTVIVPADASLSGSDIWVRVSNFGGLAVYGLGFGAWDEDETRVLLDPRDGERVVTALQHLGYYIVPEAILRRTYDGANDSFRDLYATHPPDWFTRFFDWV
jgi:hypothetical protein